MSPLSPTPPLHRFVLSICATLCTLVLAAWIDGIAGGASVAMRVDETSVAAVDCADGAPAA